mgnify:CR=1 FL=1
MRKNLGAGLMALLLAFAVMGCGEDSVDSVASDGTEAEGTESNPETNSTLCEGDSVDQVRPEGWTRETHCSKVDPNYSQVFDDTVVHRFDITVSAENYQATMNDLDSILGGVGGGGPGGGGSLDDTPEPMYVPVTLQYNGLTWDHVGMRYKGNSSLHMSWDRGIKKLAFRFNFDKFEDDFPEISNQRFYGFKKIYIGNNHYNKRKNFH